jgi:outer membrane receptor protein involved in Fe transport
MSLRFGTVLWLASLALAAPVFAQEAQPAAETEPAPAPSPSGVEEIIITSTKREANIQDVPIAVSAFSADELTNRGIDEVEDLAAVSPSIQIQTSNSASNGGTLRIRGMGTTGNNPGLEAAVGTFVDGVYRARSGQAFSDLMDIERIEVLRGPQGTLFGKNTSAGAVSIITKKPTLDEAEGFAQVELGNYSHKRVALSHSAAIIDGVLGYRISGSWSDRDGFYEDAHSGDAWGDRDRYVVRGQLLWAPQDNFELRLIGDYGQRDESCCPAQLLYAGPSSNRFSVDPDGPGPAVAPPPNGVRDLALLLGLGQDYPFIDLSSCGTIAGCGGTPVPPATTAAPPAGAYPWVRVSNKRLEQREIGTNYEPFEKVQEWGVSLEMNWDFDWATFTSITAFRDFHSKYGEDIDFSSADILKPQQGLDDIFRNASQEVRLAGSWEKLDWLVGAYLYTEDVHSDERLEYGSQAGQFVFGVTSGFRGFLPEGAGYSARWDTETEGYALFFNNTFHATEKLSFTIGARYSREEKSAQGIMNDSPIATERGVSNGFITLGAPVPISINDSVGANPLVAGGWCEDLSGTFIDPDGPGPAAAAPLLGGVRTTLRGFCDNLSWRNSATEREWTGTGSIGYAITEDINAYVTVSRGYKAGGFNLDQESVDLVVDTRYTIDPDGAGPLPPALNPLYNTAQAIVDESRFDPEFATSYEVGIKGVYLDGRARINIAGFYTKFDDFQLNTFNGLGFTISNVDEVTAAGFELESYIFPVDGVQITFGVTYADTRYGDDNGLCFPLQYPDGANNNCAPVADAGAAVSGFASGGTFDDFLADGHRITNAPAWSGSLSIYGEHSLPSTEWLGYASANLQYKGRHNTGSNLHPLKFEPHHYFLNANFGFRSPDGHWDASFWSTNLTNEYENTIIFDTVFQGGSQSTFFNAPRMYGATLKYNF